MTVKQAEFIKSAVFEKDYPAELENMEFAFVGRSNVGKSSLINSITGRNKLAKTSKTPGRTQLINYFLINREVFFVDLPGYGFAKVPKEMKKEWGQTMERYLASPRNKLVFVLLDIRRVPSEEDLEMLTWLDHYNTPFKIIFTKMDKVSNNEKFKALKDIRTKIEFSNEDVLFHSSLNNHGRDQVLEFIGAYLKDELQEEICSERTE
ncbi:MAG: ribosome biogenesis GTP-binding protein YihA/YsxC [Cetobacterium sp.]|uniref:ribosome biogenesis GTP-binding protein YihA/YsxC n=1 Tax=unclassified Cetobacterium TaxID=2630983 RepID=UPI00163CA6BE|nr:ribosome biogenesis GTP-binding protein YihA/YsxC [Cetobacterium sp. 2A]MBC2856496.1 YihA family ribosome biogenesis GTP-binding protein [Cetobacterium sp. 2A]